MCASHLPCQNRTKSVTSERSHTHCQYRCRYLLLQKEVNTSSQLSSRICSSFHLNWKSTGISITRTEVGRERRGLPFKTCEIDTTLTSRVVCLYEMRINGPDGRSEESEHKRCIIWNIKPWEGATNKLQLIVKNEFWPSPLSHVHESLVQSRILHVTSDTAPTCMAVSTCVKRIVALAFRLSSLIYKTAEASWCLW